MNPPGTPLARGGKPDFTVICEKKSEEKLSVDNKIASQPRSECVGQDVSKSTHSSDFYL